MTGARCIRLLTIAALLVFATYIFAPCTRTKHAFSVSDIPELSAPPDPEPAAPPEPTATSEPASPSEPALPAPETPYETVTIGADELEDAFTFRALRNLLPALFSSSYAWYWLRTVLQVYGIDVAREGLLMFAGLIISQLALLTSPRLPVRRRLCQVLAVFLLFCAVSAVFTHVDFLVEQARGLEKRRALENAELKEFPGPWDSTVDTRLAFGAWLAPLAFALASAALFLRSQAAPRPATATDPQTAPSLTTRLRSLPLSRRLAIAALVVFAAYLYCPAKVIEILPDGLESGVAPNGVKDFARATRIWFVHWSPPSEISALPAWLLELGPFILYHLLLLLAGAIMCHVPLLTSPRIPLRPRLCWALAIVLVLSATLVVWTHLEFLAQQAPPEPESANAIGQIQERLAFGAWLAPLAFLLAAAAVFLRRKEANERGNDSTQSGMDGSATARHPIGMHGH
jgi:hypothetical protein